MLNPPTPPTEEMQSYLDLDQEAIWTSISSLFDQLNRGPPDKADLFSTYDKKQLAEVYKRLSRYCTEAHELSSLGDDEQLNLHVYERVLCQRDSLIKDNYESFVARIDAKLSEEEAHPLIVEAVEQMLPRKKNYLDYARKKMEIAARIGLIPKPSLEGGNQGEMKSAIVS
ncbi:hypothetical protein ACQ4PT_004507 [Festuca glaucescens]